MRDNDPIYRQSLSSVYSQDSPTLPPDNFGEPIAKSPGGSDVSPMSTPRSSVNFEASDTSLVSPIESSFNLRARPAQPEQQSKSPVPRPTALPRPAHQAHARKKSKGETKWDDYSGEPTTADTGKSPQTRPGVQQPLEMQYPQLKERTKQILAGLRDRTQPQQKTAWGRAPPPVAADPLDNPPAPKEPWKGASGREAIVPPVKNNAAARNEPLKHPQRNVSKPDPIQDRARTVSPDRDWGFQPHAQRKEPEAIALQVSQRTYATQPKAKTSPKPDLSVRVIPSQEEIKPVAPLKVRSPRVRSPAEAENIASLQSPVHSPRPSQFRVNGDLAANVNKGQDIGHEQAPIDLRHPFRAPASEGEPKHTIESEPPSQASQIGHEPVSQSSWTTYTTTANDSPDSIRPTYMDQSPVPPQPTMPSPLVMRKRPISTAASNLPFSNPEAAGSRASIISRKPIPAERPRVGSGMSSASKSLPPTPIEMQASDKISTLEARLEDLSRRRRNNKKIIREKQEALKKYAIVYDTRKRMEVEKQIINLENEVLDISREEHEVGLQLHRAQRKKDREDCYEHPTGLWIKRVTT